MNDPLHHRVKTLETNHQDHHKKINNIDDRLTKTEVKVDAMDEIVKANTDSNIKQADKLTDIVIFLHEVKGGFKAFKWFIAGLVGIATIAISLIQVIFNGS